jgi:hypothetical protein
VPQKKVSESARNSSTKSSSQQVACQRDQNCTSWDLIPSFPSYYSFSFFICSLVSLPERANGFNYCSFPFKRFYRNHSLLLLASSALLSSFPTLTDLSDLTNPPSLSSEQLFVWSLPDGQQLYYDNQETVRFRIEEEIWTDQSPMGPKEREEAAGSVRGSPYVVKGSMADAGLGPCLWWDGDGEE